MNLDYGGSGGIPDPKEENEHYEETAVIDIFWTGRQMERARA